MVRLCAELHGAEIQVLRHDAGLPQVVDERGEIGIVDACQVMLGQPGKHSLILRVVAGEEEAGRQRSR